MSIEALLERIAIALENHVVTVGLAPTEEKAPAAEPVPTAPSAPAKPRGRPRKTTDAAAATSGGAAVAEATSLAAENIITTSATPAIAATSTDAVYTEGDVRNALVALQTTTGSRDKSMDILGKHTVPPGGSTLGKLPPQNYAAVIQACIAAGAAA